MIFDEIRNSAAFREALAGLKVRGGNVTLTGPGNGASAHFACAFFAETGSKFIIIAPNELSVGKIKSDLLTLGDFDAERILTLRPLEYMLYDVDARSSDVEGERVKTLYALSAGHWDALILTPAAAAQHLPEKRYIAEAAITVAPGDVIEPTELADRLAHLGYIRVTQVDGKGQYAVRGDILDVYPCGAAGPYRLEFFDNEIDTLRAFDVVSQRTVAPEASLTILPERESFIWNEKQALNVRTDLKAELLGLDPRSSAAAKLRADIERIKPFASFGGYDRYLAYITGDKTTIFDYTGRVPVLFFNVREGLEAADHVQDEYVRICETLKETSGLPEKTVGYVRGGEAALELLCDGAYSAAFFEKFDNAAPDGPMSAGGTRNLTKSRQINVACRTPEALADNADQLLATIQEWLNLKYSVCIFSESEGRLRYFNAFLEDNALEHKIAVKRGTLSEGFIYPDLGVVAVGDGLVFRHAKARAKKKLRGATLTSFADLHVGDLVVHDVHGIGRFAGIEPIVVDGNKKDYIKILYRDDGVIFVPTHQLDSVQKYINTDESEPQLSKLGSSEWQKVTGRVKGSLRTYARELVELYARRSQMRGFAFDRDTEWQKDFEADFPYEETDDQLRCTEEIKTDMEKPNPMDRLLCGDVGYGKTEVALRAAFKAVVEGKQVAFLVPTTVLAQQHYNNFVERFKKYPVKVDYLCRFRTAKERRTIMDALADGSLDIVVGTHALVNDKITFKDLGLVVIDEEQRFGVKHKEKLKEKYPAVDTLALSATPIPRTLHMSLSGIRDISVLEDPPRDRLPVQTYVAEWDAAMVKNAIYRELARGGQVFYLYNRVLTMDSKLRELRELVPEARIVAAHGQMNERELEQIMLEFYRGEFDILLCTTIIESGLDMPNVNTVIVENGERMGLSQLYQLRGRVGRGARQAYAYVTYRRGSEPGEVAEKRLRAIRENTEFGSGFKIALRDLEIRGAGSVLGEQQHGQIAAVGYETYCRLLAEVLEEVQSGGVKHTAPGKCSVEMGMCGYIDPKYIENEAARFEIYKKIANVENDEDVMELTDELVDRFGDVPDNVLNLMTVSRIRHYAEQVGFTSVIEKRADDRVMLYTGGDDPNQSLVREGIDEKDPDYLKFYVQYRKRLRISRTKTGAIVTFTFEHGAKDKDYLNDTLELLKVWAKIC